VQPVRKLFDGVFRPAQLPLFKQHNIIAARGLVHDDQLFTAMVVLIASVCSRYVFTLHKIST
jgi:hypothetical protein